MYFLLLLIGKFLYKISKLRGGSGSALPGLVIEKLSPTFFARSLHKLPGGIIVVSGTNGKTTTVKIIKDILSAKELRVLSNSTGSNMSRGIISLIIKESTLGGKLPYDCAVLEIDEAYAGRMASKLKPDFCLVLNVMRDQMDRFTEIDKTAKYLENLVKHTTKAVVLNSFDERVNKMANEVSGAAKIEFFDVSSTQRLWFPTDDDTHSDIAAITEPVEQEIKESAVVTISDMGPSFTTYMLRSGIEVKIEPKLKGTHNALNIAAAFALIQSYLPKEDSTWILNEIAKVDAAFGRGEVLVVGDKEVWIQLVKNPGGFTHALRLLGENEFDVVTFVVNDAIADGRDVSWLWDIDFSMVDTDKSKVFCSGQRAEDMALRLKYDNVQSKIIGRTSTDLIDFIKSSDIKKMIIYCTYTAMTEMRAELESLGHVKAVI